MVKNMSVWPEDYSVSGGVILMRDEICGRAVGCGGSYVGRSR